MPGARARRHGHRRDAIGIRHDGGRVGERRARPRTRQAEPAAIHPAGAVVEDHAAFTAAVAVVHGEAAGRRALALGHRCRRGHRHGIPKRAGQAFRRGDPGRGLTVEHGGCSRCQQHHAKARRTARRHRVRCGRGARDVARPHHGRILERVPAILGDQRLDVRDLDVHACARLDVGHALREDVRTLLFKQARHVPLLTRGLVHGAGDRALTDLADHHALAVRLHDRHRHAVDRTTVREREGVDRLDLRGIRVLVLLPQRDAGERAHDRGLHIGVAKRARTDELAVGRKRIESTGLRHHHDAAGERTAFGRRREEQPKHDHEPDGRRDRERTDPTRHEGWPQAGILAHRIEQAVAVGAGCRTMTLVPLAQDPIECIAGRSTVVVMGRPERERGRRAEHHGVPPFVAGFPSRSASRPRACASSL